MKGNKNKSDLKIVMIIIVATLLLTTTFVFITSINNSPTSNSPANAVGVASKFGCIKTLDDSKTFEAKQKFTYDILGYKLVRCS